MTFEKLFNHENNLNTIFLLIPIFAVLVACDSTYSVKDAEAYENAVEKLKTLKEPEFPAAWRKLVDTNINYSLSPQSRTFDCSEIPLKFERSTQILQSIKLRHETMSLPIHGFTGVELTNLYRQAGGSFYLRNSFKGCNQDDSSRQAIEKEKIANQKAEEYLKDTKIFIAKRYFEVARGTFNYAPTIEAEIAKQDGNKLRYQWDGQSESEKSQYAGGDAVVKACIDAALKNNASAEGIPSIIEDTASLCRQGLGR